MQGWPSYKVKMEAKVDSRGILLKYWIQPLVKACSTMNQDKFKNPRMLFQIILRGFQVIISFTSRNEFGKYTDRDWSLTASISKIKKTPDHTARLLIFS